MVSQVKVVAILMIVYGAIMSLTGLGVAAFVPFMIAVDNSASVNRRRDETGMMVMLVIFLVGGLLILAIGVLHLIAGIRCLKFRGRVLALVALFSNIPAVFTGYCSLFAIGMAVYGLIVMFDGDVARAFERGEEGVSPEDILLEFAPRPSYRRRRRSVDDYWDQPEDDDRRDRR